MRIKLLFILLILEVSAFGQIKILRIPEDFKSPYENVNIHEKHTVSSPNLWTVYSDRLNNKTYTASDGITPLKNLGFLEVFYVTEENKDFIHIIKANKEDINYINFTTTKYDDYGWVNKAKMMLWSQCLLSKKSGMTKKAMVLNNLEWATKVKDGDNTDIMKFYKDPDLTIPTGDQAQMFQIFYIYKISDDHNSILIGKTSRISDQTSPGEIVGWAPRQRLVYWDHRVAVEPNWNETAVFDRKSKGIKSVVLRDMTEAQNFASTGKYDENNVLWDDDPYADRRIGDYMRFPFYSSQEQSGIIKSGVWGSPFTKEGETIQGEVMAGINRKLSQMVEKRRNINIVFVIDGSSSMMPYFRPVALAVTANINRLSQAKNNIKFASVVYRDYSEGEYLCERIKLTTDYEEVNQWLMDVYSTTKNMNDRDEPEAVFYGIRDALRNVNMPENETNYLVLIGDAGNHYRNDESQVDREELTNLLSAKNVNFMAFQVNHKGNQNYDNFVVHAKDLILTSSFKIWRKDEAVYRQFGLTSLPKFIKNSASVSELDQSPNGGKLVQCLPNKSVSPYELKEQLIAFINKAESDIDKTIEMLNDIKEGKGVSGIASNSEYKPALVNMLAQSGVTPAQLELLKKARFQFYTTGYSLLKPEQLKYDLFQSVVFVTREELGGIISDISRLLQKKSNSEVRQHLYNSFIKLLEDHLGESSAGNMQEKSMEEITKLLFGLPSTSEFLKGVKLTTIIDPSIFTDDELAFWINEMEAKLKALKNIQNTNNYKYSFESNDEYYYWIAQSNLP